MRERFNVVVRVLIMKDGKTPLSSDDFPHLNTPSGSQANDDYLFKLPASGIDYDEFQRSIVRQSLEMTMGNQSAAARLLNVSRARFRTLLGLFADADGNVSIKIRVKQRMGGVEQE